MKRLLSWLVTVALLGTVGLVGLVAWVFISSERRLGRVYDVPARQLAIRSSDADRERGARLARVWGCLDCHGEDLGGATVVDGPPMLLVAPNLTSGRGGVAAVYEDEDWARAVRHGVRPDGRPLVYMPSQDYYGLSDADLGAMVAYIEGAEPVDRVQPPTVVRGLGRFLFVTGRLPLIPAELISHEAPRPTAPPVGETVAYGAYLAAGCEGCHGSDLTGGVVPGAPPTWPTASNLTPDSVTGLGRWTLEDFRRALREGKRPDGTDLDPAMPWQNTAAMTDVELNALWTYLRTVPVPESVVTDPGEGP